jgi:hypothetical protein
MGDTFVGPYNTIAGKFDRKDKTIEIITNFFSKAVSSVFRTVDIPTNTAVLQISNDSVKQEESKRIVEISPFPFNVYNNNYSLYYFLYARSDFGIVLTV